MPSSMPDVNKRRHPRALCSQIVRMMFCDQARRKIVETGLIEDVGRNGLRISIGLPISPGKEVEFETTGFAGFALVRYCEFVDGGYAWGLEFPIGFEWDGTGWNPEHLLELPLKPRKS